MVWVGEILGPFESHLTQVYNCHNCSPTETEGEVAEASAISNSFAAYKMRQPYSAVLC